MTGTNLGELRTPLTQRPQSISPTGRPVHVPHMHMIRWRDGRSTELLHLMDTMALLGQLGLLPAQSPEPVHS
jgi:hypothetical protein